MTDVNAFLHAMPEAAQEEILKRGLVAESIGEGVNRLQMSGHDRGIAYRFENYQDYNKVKSDVAGYEVFDEVPIIRWLKTRKMQPVARVDSLGPELLKFNREGECVGGRYKDAYIRWKEGKSSIGLALGRWGVLSDGEVASLEADGIYTVEQFAGLPRERVVGKYPQQFVDAYDRANQFMASRDIRAAANKSAEELVALKKENEDLAKRLAELEARAVEKPKNKLVGKEK